MKRLTIFSLLLVSSVVLAYSQDEQMLLDPKIRDHFNEVFSGELAKDHVVQKLES